MIIPDGINSSIQLGAWGEMVVIHLLHRAGIAAEATPHSKLGDVRAISPSGKVMRLEVKTARQSRDGSYQFCLRREVDGRVCTDCTRADLVILLAVSAGGILTATYIIPSIALKGKLKLSLPKRLRGYRGKWAEYRRPVEIGVMKWLK